MTSCLLTFLHELSNDINGLLLGDHSIESDQFVMLKLLHEVGLCHEGFNRHTTRLHGLHSHLCVLVVCS